MSPIPFWTPSALDQGTPDLVVTVATLATRAGRDLLSGTKIPHMFLIVTDPVGEGFVSEMGKTSGANITGQSHVVPVESQLALVSQILQTAKRDRPFRIGSCVPPRTSSRSCASPTSASPTCPETADARKWQNRRRN